MHIYVTLSRWKALKKTHKYRQRTSTKARKNLTLTHCVTSHFPSFTFKRTHTHSGNDSSSRSSIGGIEKNICKYIYTYIINLKKKSERELEAHEKKCVEVLMEFCDVVQLIVSIQGSTYWPVIISIFHNFMGNCMEKMGCLVGTLSFKADSRNE